MVDCASISNEILSRNPLIKQILSRRVHPWALMNEALKQPERLNWQNQIKQVKFAILTGPAQPLFITRRSPVTKTYESIKTEPNQPSRLLAAA